MIHFNKFEHNKNIDKYNQTKKNDKIYIMTSFNKQILLMAKKMQI